MRGREPMAGQKRSFLSLAASGAAWCAYLFLIMPSLIVIPISFGERTSVTFPPERFSLDLYHQYFFEDQWMAATALSLRVAVGATVISLIAGVLAAYALVRCEFPGKKLVSIFLLSPILVPIIAVALGLYLYFNSIGIRGSDLSLILGHSVVTTPFVIVTAMAGLRHIDANLEIAATVMGAGRWRTLWRVTLPLLKPAIMAGALFAFLLSFDEVVIAWFVAQTAKATLPVAMYSSIQWSGVSPVLAAISTLLTVLSMAICLAVAAVTGKEKR